MDSYIDARDWKELKAVKNKDIYIVYAMFRSDVDCFINLQYMATMLYPEIFTGNADAAIDPSAVLADFYAKFMPLEAKGTWFYKYS